MDSALQQRCAFYHRVEISVPFNRWDSYLIAAPCIEVCDS